MSRRHQEPNRMRLRAAFPSVILAAVTLAIGPQCLAGEEYRLQAGDRLAITVWDHADLGGERLIRPDGVLSLPLIGTVSARGLTPKELAATLTERFAEYLVAPRVAVDLVELPSTLVRVYVTGRVSRPGSYQLPEGSGVLQAITEAGGPGEDSDRTHVSLLRADSPPRTVDLGEAEKGTAAANIVLQDGDVLVVPQAQVLRLSVIGAVESPGSFEIDKETAILDVVSQAGGTTESADLANAVITRRDGTTERVDLAKLLREGDLATNAQLAAGDSLFVPFRHNRLTVTGRVAKPGVFTLQEPVTYAEVLGMAEGAEPDADLSQVVHTGADGTTRIVDVGTLLTSPTGQPTQAVLPGDVLYVPARRSVVSVVGRVTAPGSYRLEEKQRVLDILAVAGPLLDDADGATATLTHRDGTSQPLALDALLEEGDLHQNLLLQPDDVITVPRRREHVYMFGHVDDPGRHPLGKEAGVLDAIDSAGGFVDDADLGRIVVVRQQGETEPEVIPVDLGAFISKGDKTQNRKLQDGDIVFVPRRKQRFRARDILEYLWALDLLRRIVRND